MPRRGQPGGDKYVEVGKLREWWYRLESERMIKPKKYPPMTKQERKNIKEMLARLEEGRRNGSAG